MDRSIDKRGTDKRGTDKRGIDIRGDRQSIEGFLAHWFDDRPWIEAHTSGSTGEPKTIRLAKADMEESARATCRYFGLGPGSHLVMPLSADYIAGKMMVVRALASGATLSVVPPSRSLDGLADALQVGGIDLLPIVPAQLEALLASPVASHVRNVIIGGAPLSAAQIAAIRASGLNAYATYGMTETCSHVALRRLIDSDSYEAMPGITFSIEGDISVDMTGRGRPSPQSVGALVIHAPHYSAQRFVTNDMVRLIDERHFQWLGRRDNVINSGGIKIFPEHVEELLRPYLAGLDFYVSSRPSDLWGEELILVITDDAPYPSPMLAEAGLHLPHHLLPKATLRLPAFAYTANGKLKRKA